MHIPRGMRALVAGILCSVAFSATRRICAVSYATQSGWSDPVKTEVTFMTGQELNKATHTFNFIAFDKFALVWFAQGEVAILKFNDLVFLSGMEFTALDFVNAFQVFSEKTFTQVNTQYSRDWKIEAKEFFNWIDPRASRYSY